MEGRLEKSKKKVKNKEDATQDQCNVIKKFKQDTPRSIT